MRVTVASIWAVTGAMLALQELCGLLHPLCGSLQPLCGLSLVKAGNEDREPIFSWAVAIDSKGGLMVPGALWAATFSV